MRSARTLTLARLASRQVRARWTSYVPTAIGLAAALALWRAAGRSSSAVEAPNGD